ncbi:hypothetical protein L873DRAFT_1818800, partial [Choiromyces venosus 120613-1]
MTGWHWRSTCGPAPESSRSLVIWFRGGFLLCQEWLRDSEWAVYDVFVAGGQEVDFFQGALGWGEYLMP